MPSYCRYQKNSNAASALVQLQILITFELMECEVPIDYTLLYVAMAFHSF